MLDDSITIPKEEAKVYPPLPKNVYQVELLDINLKDAKGKYAKPGDKNFSFQFTLLEGKEEDKELRGRNVWSNFVPTSLYLKKTGKNELYQIIEAMLKREITPEEEAKGLTGTDLNSLIGKQVKVFIDHTKKDDKVYDNITSYMPINDEKTALNSEEKEDARVKTNDKTEEAQTTPEQALKETTEINNEKSPAQQMKQGMESVQNTPEEELSTEQIPF